MRPAGIRVSIYRTPRAAAQALARHLADAVARNPSLVLGLPTGRTPVRLYHELAALAAQGKADFSKTRTFNLDEFVGIDRWHPGSYRRFMETRLFGPAGISDEQVCFLDGAAADLEAECARYERAIADAGGIDILILGIGTNGHIGFNEPARELHSQTHRVALRSETRRANASLFAGDPSAVPAEGLSMGMATILRARSIVLLATGVSKAACVARAVSGAITTRLPASFLQLHGDVELVLDEAAAEKLTI